MMYAAMDGISWDAESLLSQSESVGIRRSIQKMFLFFKINTAGENRAQKINDEIVWLTLGGFASLYKFLLEI